MENQPSLRGKKCAFSKSYVGDKAEAFSRGLFILSGSRGRIISACIRIYRISGSKGLSSLYIGLHTHTRKFCLHLHIDTHLSYYSDKTNQTSLGCTFIFDRVYAVMVFLWKHPGIFFSGWSRDLRSLHFHSRLLLFFRLFITFYLLLSRQLWLVYEIPWFHYTSKHHQYFLLISVTLGTLSVTRYFATSSLFR